MARNSVEVRKNKGSYQTFYLILYSVDLINNVLSIGWCCTRGIPHAKPWLHFSDGFLDEGNLVREVFDQTHGSPDSRDRKSPVSTERSSWPPHRGLKLLNKENKSGILQTAKYSNNIELVTIVNSG